MTTRAVLLLTCALAACHTPLTEIVIQTSSDLMVPSQLDAVRFEVDARRIGAHDVIVRDATLTGDDANAFPIVLGLLHEGDAPLGPIEVRAIGLRHDVEVVRNVTVTYFVPQRSVLLPLDLWAACAGIQCPSGQTCTSAGTCVNIVLDPPDAGTDAARDSGSDAGVDAGQIDGGYCLPDDVCFDGCGCSGGCVCDLKCERDTSCYGNFCSDPGTSCSYKPDGSSYFDFACRDGAYCVSDVRGYSVVGNFVCTNSECWTRCKDSTDCPIHCDNGARCVLKCENAENCRFETCHAGVVSDCGAGVFTCNYACPSSFPAW